MIRPRATVVVTLSIMIFTAATSLLSGLYSAPSAYAGGDYFVISEASAPTIFSSHVDIEMIDALSSMENITAASGEVFAFSTFGGVSFFVRGIGEGFGTSISPTAEEISWAPGVAPPEDSMPRAWAIVGAGLLERFDIDLPLLVPLVGSYSPKVEMVYLSGSFETGTSLDDELVVTNEVARQLSGMRADEVSIIRVVTSQPDWLESLLSPDNARFVLLDLTLSKAKVAVWETLSVRVEVRNWGGSAGTVEVAISDGGAPLGSYQVSLNATSSRTIQAEFEFDSLGNHTIVASVSGDFPVRLYANFSVIEPYLVVSAPAKIALGSMFSVSITDYTGLPAAGCSVSFQNQLVTADSFGRADLTATMIGSHAVTASLAGYLNGTRSVVVVDPSDYPNVFSPDIVSFSLQPQTISESETATGVAVVENNGTVAGTFEVIAYVDSVPWKSSSVNLEAMSASTWVFEIESLSVGSHVVQVGNLSFSLQVEAWYADDSDLLQLVLRYGSTSSLSSANSIPIYQAAQISEGNVAAALFAIGGVSALLAFLAITSIFAKEIREHRRALGVLRTIGASTSAVQRMVFPQAFIVGLVGAAIGIFFAVILVDSLSASSALMAFGHRFAVEPDGRILLLTMLSAVAISVFSALGSAIMTARETAVSSIRALDESDVVDDEGQAEVRHQS